MSPRPMTLAEAEKRGLYTGHRNGIHTFSNGTESMCWMEPNCFSCWFYDRDGTAGEHCAFEGAALLGGVSPAMAEFFGWTQHTAEYGPLSGWDAPDQCACFLARPKRDDGSDDDSPPPPPPDPNQLVLIADPTEDAATITSAPVVDLVEVA